MNPVSVEPSSAVRIKNFRLYLYFRLALTFATQMQGVIVGWQLYAITNSVLVLGFIGLAEAVPYLGTSLLGGHVADIVDRRRINLVCSAVFTLCSVALLGVTLLERRVVHAEFWFYAIIFMTGIARGFLGPSLSGLFAQIVPRRFYLSASAWSSNTWQIAAVAGPAAGGLAYGFWGVVPAYLLLIGISCSSFVFMWLIPSHPLDFHVQEESIFQSIAKGIQFVYSNQIILAAMALDLVAVLFGGAIAVLPVFASDVLHTGPEGLGYLRAAPFLGSVVMGMFLALQRPMRHAGESMLLCVAGFGVCMILFALSKNLALSFALLFFSGVFDSVSVVIRATTLQLMMPNDMRGRVSAVNNIFVGTSNELGAFESGVAARLLGLVPSVVIGGAISIVSVVAAGLAAPKLRKLNLQTLSDVE